MKAFFNGVPKEVPEVWAHHFLSRKRTAVITVGFSKLHLKFPKSPFLPDDASLLPGVNTFLSKAREYNMPIIHTMMGTDGRYSQKSSAVYEYVWPMTLGELPKVPVEPDSFEVSVEIAPLDFLLAQQRRLSIFYGTDLEILLRDLNIERVILLGTMTDCCILEAAFEAADRDFWPIVLQDLCSGTAALQEASTKIMSLHCALVVNSVDLLAEWQK